MEIPVQEAIVPVPVEAVVETPASEEAEETEQKIPLKSMAEQMDGKLLSKLAFSWDEQVAASVFKRAGYLWIVFDKAKEVKERALTTLRN